MLAQDEVGKAQLFVHISNVLGCLAALEQFACRLNRSLRVAVAVGLHLFNQWVPVLRKSNGHVAMLLDVARDAAILGVLS